MTYNEAETRYHLIDPVLRDKGYLEWRIKLETPAPVEPTGAKGRRRGNGRTDYLLCVRHPHHEKPLPVGVIEAKAEGEDPLKGMQQAKDYSDCQRFHVQYVFATNGHRYGEYDKTTRLSSGPHAFPDFPHHNTLSQRYARATGVDPAESSAKLMFMADSPSFSVKPRYYQDAAIRAAFALPIQVPSIGEQRRIATRLKEQLAAVEEAGVASEQCVKDLAKLCDLGLERSLESCLRSGGETVNLGDVARIEAKQVDPCDTRYSHFPHVSGENIVSISGELNNIQSAEQDGMKSGKYLFDAGDVLYSKLRPYLRKAALPTFSGLCSADMYPLKTDSLRLLPSFLRLVLTSRYFTSYANEKAERSRMPKLNREQLFEWKFPLPAIE